VGGSRRQPVGGRGKFVAAAVTGSAAMLSEAVHSLVDTITSFCCYTHGPLRATADRDHPLGYARELYFWSFVWRCSSLPSVPAVGLPGYPASFDPQAIENRGSSTSSSRLAAVRGRFLVVGARAFRKTQRLWDGGMPSGSRRTPPAFIVVFEDSARS